MAFANLVKLAVSGTPGTGTITLGSAVSPYFGTSELTDGSTYSYSILDGSNICSGHGVYTASGTTLTRDAAERCNVAGTPQSTPMSLTSAAVVSITLLGRDLVKYIRRPVFFAVGGGASLLLVGLAGDSSSGTNSGTVSQQGGSASVYNTRYASAATTASRASAEVALSNYIPSRSSRGAPGLGISATIDFSDAYSTGGARLGFGATRVTANAMNADDGDAASNNSQGIWFSYSTVRGGNWRIVVRLDLSNVTVIDTGVAFSAGTWSFALDFSDSGTSFDWSIRKAGGTATTGTVTSGTAPLPTNVSTTYVLFAAVVTLSNAAKYLGIMRYGADLLEPQ